MMNRNNTRKLTNLLFQGLNFTPHVLSELDLLVNLYSYVEQGIGASIVSDTLVRIFRGVDNSRVVFYSLPTEHAQRCIFANYKRNKFFSNPMETYIDSLEGLQ